MFTLIRGTLIRQEKALELMYSLLEEEFSLLMERDSDAIMTLEFSIHELLRQLAAEKEYVIRSLGGGKLHDYAQMLPDDSQKNILELWHRIDKQEQLCARQAAQNTRLSLGLLDQSKELLDFLHERIIPPQRTAYSNKGKYTQNRPQPAMFVGRF